MRDNRPRSQKDLVRFVGYQAEATLGRSLVEGARSVEIDGLNVEVGAEIHYLHGFSAHGDTNDYLAWLGRYYSENLSKIFLVHAEEDRSSRMKEILIQEGKDHPYVPVWKEVIELN
jgi:metallo-beta-lactamase family protein